MGESLDAELGRSDEAELVRRVQSGDAAAFSRLVRAYLRPAYGVAWRILRNRQDVEDLVQESFMAALDKIGSFDARRPFAPWFLRIVANRAINARKARGVRAAEPIPADARSAGATPEALAERNESDRALHRALESLPERQRVIVRLFELEGYSSAEVGAMLGLSDATVRWHLHKARAALRQAMDEALR